jgi:glucokinase
MRIGVDIGGTNLVAGLVDEKFNLIDKVNTPTLGKRAAEEIVADILMLCETLMQKYNLAESAVESIGLGVPGWYNPDAGVILSCDYVNFRNTPIAEMIQKKINVPVFLGNDADCAALGEAYGGATKDVAHSLMVTVGTGIGGGIIINKRIYNGFNHGGAEIGHMSIDLNGIPCVCGRRGCWENYASATALIRQTREAVQANPDSVLSKLVDGDLDKINGKTAFDALHAGCPVGTAVVDGFVRYFAEGLISLITILQPEIAVIGGGVSKAGDAFLGRLTKIVEKECYGASDALPKTRICIAELGNDAGVIGAAALGI